MKRNFEFTYYFNNTDLRICYDYGISEDQIEEKIKKYIIKKNINREEDFLINLNNNVEIDFNIVDISNGVYSIEVDNLYLNN